MPRLLEHAPMMFQPAFAPAFQAEDARAHPPLELRARLTARQYSRQAGKVANAALGPILAGEDMDPGGLRARPQTGTLKTREESDRIRASLDRLTLLDSVGPAKKELMVKAIKTRHYAAGETVFSQGALADGFYIIERGSLRVMEQSEETGSAPVEKRVLKSGVCFGELALIHSSRRTASARLACRMRVRYCRIAARSPTARWSLTPLCESMPGA